SSGSEALNLPGAAAARVEEPVMQPVLASLPEFDPLRDHPVAAPVVGTRRVVAVLVLFSLHGLFQLLPRSHHGALRRGAGGEARARRPAREVIIRLLRAHSVHAPLDAHLALERRPEEDQARRGACAELAALAALVVGVEDEPAL